MMNQQTIPQRKQPSQPKYEQQRNHFNNTNVFTGISSSAQTATSYRTATSSSANAKQLPQDSCSQEKMKKGYASNNGAGTGAGTAADKTLSPNTKLMNSAQAHPTQQYVSHHHPQSHLSHNQLAHSHQNQHNGFNSTAPIKFSHHTTNIKTAYQENVPHYQESAMYNDSSKEVGNEPVSYSSSKTTTQRTASQGGVGALAKANQQAQPYSRQTGGLTQIQKSSFVQQQTQNAGQLNTQSSSNNLRNKYNRNQGQIAQPTGGRSSTTGGGSKSSSSKNLLNKTQQQISSNVLAQANAQFKEQQRRESVVGGHKGEKSPLATPSQVTGGTLQSSRNNTNPKSPSNIRATETIISSANNQPPQSSQQIISAHKATLNEYKQFMEKQKLMLKQLQSNKLAMMLNALNTSPHQIQQQIQSKKASGAPSQLQSPKNQQPIFPQKVLQQRQVTQLEEQAKENCGQPVEQPPLYQMTATTPRGGAPHILTEAKVNQCHQQQYPQNNEVKSQNTQIANNCPVSTNGGATPRAMHQQQPQQNKADCECAGEQQPQQQPKVTPIGENNEHNPNDDSMCFSSKSSLEDYIIGKQIGQGAYAVVRIGLHKPSNRKVAMKIYKKYKLLDPNRRKSVKREIKLMEKMKHPNIIRLHEVIDTSKYVILVMEYVGGGSLHGYLKAKPTRRLDENDAKRIFKQVLEGIKYCHSRCITHRDIKLENLLLDDQNNIKIIDFGFSTCIPNEKKIKIFCGTPSYMAPEIVQKLEYAGPPADIWALGVLLFTILSGCFPYRGATDKELYKKIMRADYKLPSEVQSSLSPEAVNLLKKLFAIDANKRPSAREVLNDPWLMVDQPLQKPVRSLSSQPQIVQQQQLNQQQVYKKANTDCAMDKEDQNQTQQRVFQPSKGSETTQQAAYNAYFGNVQVNLQPTHSSHANPKEYSSTPTHQQQQQQNQQQQQQNPYQDNSQFQSSSSTLGPSLQSSARNVYINSGHGAQNLLSGGNTINNNFNIINNIMQINCNDKNPHQQQQQARAQGGQSSPPSDECDEQVVATIVNKLGYSIEEVKKYIREENSFVSVLYQKLLDEQSRSRGAAAHSLSAKLAVQPSFVPSIASSSLNQANISAATYSSNNGGTGAGGNNNNNNQGHHNYYGSYHDSTSQLSQTMTSHAFLNNSVISSGLNNTTSLVRGSGKTDMSMPFNPHQRNRDASLGGLMSNTQQTGYDMLSSDEDIHTMRGNTTMMLSLGGGGGGGHPNLIGASSGAFNNTANLNALLNGSSIGTPGMCQDGEGDSFSMTHGGGLLLGGNNTQPLNLHQYNQHHHHNLQGAGMGAGVGGGYHNKKNSLGNNEMLSGTITGGGLNNKRGQQPNGLLNKNLQWRREFI